MLRCGVSSVVSACIFALCKLLLFYNYVCCVDLLAFTVGVASGLNAAGDGDLRSLTQVFLCKFRLAAKCYTTDEICCCDRRLCGICGQQPVYNGLPLWNSLQQSI